MVAFFLADENLLFAIALALMLTLALVEGVGLLLGAGLSSMVDEFFPDSEMEIDLPETEAPSLMGKLYGWIHVKNVPVLVLFVLFLTFFSLEGYGVQWVVYSVSGELLPAAVVGIPTLLLAWMTTRSTGHLFARAIPKDESSAVSENSFIGRVAVITLGKAAAGSPAEARLSDHYGQTHYVMVEPDDVEETFVQGDSVLLAARVGNVYRVLRVTDAALRA